MLECTDYCCPELPTRSFILRVRFESASSPTGDSVYPAVVLSARNQRAEPPLTSLSPSSCQDLRQRECRLLL